MLKLPVAESCDDVSERGVVCSNYFYCKDCARATETIFQRWYEYVTPVMVPAQLAFDGSPYPIIIVGKAHSAHPGQELSEFEDDVAPALADVLCHSARFAIMGDDEDCNAIAVVVPSVKKVTPVETKRLSR